MQFPSRKARVALLAGCATFGLAGTASAASTATYDTNTKLLAVAVSGADEVEIVCDGGDVKVDGVDPARTPVPGGTTGCANPTEISVTEEAGTSDGNRVDLRGVRTEDYTALLKTTFDLGAGGDTMFGTEGADTMIWNPGDGSDVMNGGDGVDTVQDNGGGGIDQFVIKPKDGDPSRVDASRINNPFTLDIGGTENLVVSGNGGDDTITGSAGLAGLIKTQMIGGEGNDTLVGTDGADDMDGGVGNDSLTGFRGNDDMDGDEGDDLMVWNPGDGSDTMDGGAGADIAQDNGGGGNEHFIVTAQGDRVTATRDNTGPFFLNIGTTETLDLNANAGDDSVEVNAGLAALIKVDVDLGEGNDSVSSRNDSAEILDGGAGTDSAIVDATDQVVGFETVDSGAVTPPPPAADTEKPKVTFESKRLRVRNGKARIKVSLPDDESDVTGRIKIRYRGKTAGSKKIELSGGDEKSFKVRLKRRVRVKLAKDDDGKIRTTVKIKLTDDAGNTGVSKRRLNLVG